MKKITVFVLALIFIAAGFITATSAVTIPEQGRTAPGDWLITEICVDQAGDGLGASGYVSGGDAFEYIEIYNCSGITLSLYDYCLTYCSAYRPDYRANERFEIEITEITPFLTNNQWTDKPGNYFDGSTNSGLGSTNVSMTTANAPTNPQTFDVAAGETVVIWMYNWEDYYEIYNSGLGMALTDFRDFYKLDESTKVVVADGNSSSGCFGNEKNFNLRNDSIATYGIARYSEELNQAANTSNSVYIEETGYVGGLNMECWATLDFVQEIAVASIANYSYNFVPDYDFLSAKKWNHAPDMRRMVLFEYIATPTPGALTDLQKLYCGYNMLQAGEILDLNMTGDDLSINVFVSYDNAEKEDFLGWNVNGLLYPIDSKLTVPSGGVVEFGLAYGNASDYTTVGDENSTAPDDTTTVEDTTTTGTDTTANSADPGTDEPTSAEPSDTEPEPTDRPSVTTADNSTEDKSCGSVGIVASVLCFVSIIGTAITVTYGKH